MLSTELNATLGERIDYGPQLSIFRIYPKGWPIPDYKSGQFATLGLPGNSPRIASAEPEKYPPKDPTKFIRRAYSIASEPANKDYIEFNINMVSFGCFTPRLWNLKVGDGINLSDKISGEFTMASVPTDKNVLFVATGTGLAPYISMLKTELKPGLNRKFCVFHGVRVSQDLSYRAELEIMARAHPNFAYFPIVSRPQEDPIPWKGSNGRVQVLWDEKQIENAWGIKPTPDNTHVFLCGSPGMITDMTAKLTQDGFKEHSRKEPGQIHVEKYW